MILGNPNSTSQEASDDEIAKLRTENVKLRGVLAYIAFGPEMGSDSMILKAVKQAAKEVLERSNSINTAPPAGCF